jgi:hypothetical protein
MEPKGSLPHSQVPATYLYPEPAQSIPYAHILLLEGPFVCEYFVTKIRFHSEVLLAPRPNPKLEGHPLSAVRDCLFNVFAATLHIGGRSSIHNLRTRHAVVTETLYNMGDVNNRVLAGTALVSLKRTAGIFIFFFFPITHL